MDPRLEQSPAGAPEITRVLRHCRAPADCFGANPVASALGNLARRDPGEAVRTYHEDPKPNPETGTFYLAGIRNFLFGSDTQKGFWESLCFSRSERPSTGGSNYLLVESRMTARH